MHPAAAGGAVRSVRAVARANIILGLLAMAAMALLAATMLNPGDLVLQRLLPLLCVATVAEAQGVREAALELVLIGVVQAVFAAAGSLHMLGQWLTAPEHIIGAINACYFCYIVGRAAVVAIGQYPARNHIIRYVLVAVSYAALLGVSVAVAFRW